jgi:hypothetical protein
MNGQESNDKSRGQSVVEIAIVLPVLLILLFGLVEVGFGLRNYLLVANANREAARFAARARFNDAEIAARMLAAGGTETVSGKVVPFLRTDFPEDAGTGDPIYEASPNTAIIITHVPMDTDGNVDPADVTYYIAGVYPCGACTGIDPVLILTDGLRFANAISDSKIVLADVVTGHGPATEQINDLRFASDFPEMENNIIVVETFFAHEPLGEGLLPSPWIMYTHTEIRAIGGRQQE